MTEATSLDPAQLWADHGKAMLAAAKSMLRNRVVDGTSYEDVVHDVLRDVTRKPSGVLGAPSERAYLVRAVKNRATSALKRGSRQPTVAPDDALFERSSRGDEVGDDVVDLQMSANVAASLDRLSPRQRYAIVQRVMMGRPSVEVAGEMDCAPQNISQLVNRGLATLRADPTFDRLVQDDQEMEQTNDEEDERGRDR